MFLIASGAYCSAELQSEFGSLPPSFLPLGNRRLFQHQIENVVLEEKVYISLPESFEVADCDKQWLLDRNVQLISLPEQLSLGESIVAALNLMDFEEGDSLTLLYGDTLLTAAYPNQQDCVTVSDVEDNYQWAYINQDQDGKPWLQERSNYQVNNTNQVVNGFFRFSDPKGLIKSLVAKRWNFLEGVSHYHQSHPMTVISAQNWLDFGHIHTYFRSKASFTTQRSFNELEITSDSVKKSSSNNNKIEAEALWFENIPSKLRRFLPQLLNIDIKENNVSYELEYLHHTALNELFVFGRLPIMTWKRILKGCFSFIDACQSHASQNFTHQSLEHTFKGKTSERLSVFCDTQKIDPKSIWNFNGNKKHSIESLLTLANKHLPRGKAQSTVIHGDFCFSNILFDFRTSSIKTIDPRGLTSNGDFSIYGDVRYDIAKLSHSVIGEYDWIIAGYYKLSRKGYCINFNLSSNDTLYDVQSLFIDKVKKKYGISYVELLAMQLHLFLSMLPLHCDDESRQFALFANAFRIANLLEEAL
ncbi:capsular biosynthesis protein [Enterovibrio norvegicus]|uniref:capsular biosynthesis protein n=1 Tax=Enterovibrio norvegicus TaxID=188144 RepID=UPI0010BEDDF2|nr:capsular biosynthesis protein [Enterovibrio norvegicus]TKF36290.1 capsular biosynthesis protein [Enterovibrio norvegicus]